MREIVFGDDEQAAGVAVQAVHDAGAQRAADSGESGEAVQQSIDQGAAVAGGVLRAGSGVDHHSGGLIDDRKVVVFIDDVQLDGLGKGAQGLGFRRSKQRDTVAGPQLGRGLGGAVIAPASDRRRSVAGRGRG